VLAAAALLQRQRAARLVCSREEIARRFEVSWALAVRSAKPLQPPRVELPLLVEAAPAVRRRPRVWAANSVLPALPTLLRRARAEPQVSRH
jgi:hypothetical protein